MAIPKGQFRRPRRGSKSEAILTLATTTPARPIEIAESVHTCKAHVTQTLQRYGVDINTVESYKKHRAELLAGVQAKYLSLVNDEAIKGMIERRGMVDFGIMYDKERLERGQSSVNMSLVLQDVAAIREMESVDNHVDK